MTADKKHEQELKAFKGAAWFEDEFGFLKKGAKPRPRLPPEDLFNLDSSALVKMIHDCHHTPILKTKALAPTTNNKGNEGEINVTHEDTDGDSASHSLSSSSTKDDNASNHWSRSKTSEEDDEKEKSTTGGG